MRFNLNKNIVIIIALAIIVAGVAALVLVNRNGTQPSQSSPAETNRAAVNGEEKTVEKIFINVNNKKLEVKLADNSSAKALVEKLQTGNVSVDAQDYGGFEKVGSLGFSLPTNDERITTEPGDVILYQGDKLALYYDRNSWSFTRLGHIDITQVELKSTLGDGGVTLVLSLE